jgi:hypothetical protein
MRTKTMPDRKEMKDEKGSGDFSPMRLDAATRAIQKYLNERDPMSDEFVPGPMRELREKRRREEDPMSDEFVPTPIRRMRAEQRKTPGDSPYIPDSPEEGIPGMGESPTEVTAGAAEMLQQREPRGPKSEHRRFAESKETSYDKVATRAGDPFEYAMKGDRIFVRKKGEEEFRDVTGIANDSQIRALINEHGKAQEKKDERPHTFRRSGGEPMSVQERTGVEDRPPVTTEDFGQKLTPEDVRILQQMTAKSMSR